MMLKVSFMVIFDVKISIHYSKNPLKREGISIYPAFPIQTILQGNCVVDKGKFFIFIF